VVGVSHLVWTVMPLLCPYGFVMVQLSLLASLPCDLLSADQYVATLMSNQRFGIIMHGITVLFVS
jgi:hypothetical protein